MRIHGESMQKRSVRIPTTRFSCNSRPLSGISCIVCVPGRRGTRGSCVREARAAISFSLLFPRSFFTRVLVILVLRTVQKCAISLLRLYTTLVNVKESHIFKNRTYLLKDAVFTVTGETWSAIIDDKLSAYVARIYRSVFYHISTLILI